MDTRSTPTSAKRSHDMNLAYFKIRITAKLCVGVIFFLQAITRTLALVFDTAMTSTSRLFLIISMPFCFMIPLIITFEYLLFKKKGAGIVKYSTLIDIVLLLVFLGDWSMSEVSDLNRIQQTNPISFKIGALYGFTAFSWRTLMLTLIVQKWQLKIIAPSMAVLIAMGYCIYYNPSNPLWVLVRAITQLSYIILIVYCEDKVKWKLMLTNLQQEKWMQVNDFILNSIPENIMILNLAGETKFISEYCKSFIKKCNLSLETAKDLFGKIRDLNQQYETEPFNSDSILNMERLTTCNGLLTDNNSHQENYHKIEVLEDLITNFKSVIKSKNLQERQFLIYNGKLKTTETLPPQPEKSIEVKISFVQHFENDYIILIFRDTTQRDLLVALEETNKYKDQLLASVSHELRAPLNGNINLVESAVNSPKIPESVKETLLIPALRSSKFLLHIINDILDMSQIKEKKLRLIFESLDLKETLKSTAQLIELQAQKKGIELIVELDPKLPKNFCTDHIRLSQIVLNLLTNAIKFTKEGAVKLIAAPVQGTSWFRITVEDSGIGMNQENLKKLFSSYTHIDFEGRQLMNPTGVGLGLNIAHNLAELLAPKLQQGIRVASIPNQGSIFSFTIENKEKVPEDEIYDINGHKSANSSSCEVADEAIQPMVFERLQTVGSSCSLPSAIPKAESQFEFLEGPHCSCPKVLIVDDNPFNTMALEAILNSLEIKCNSVYSGSSAIQKLCGLQSSSCCGNKECNAYSVVFMDQEMPEMSGADAVREIRRLQGEGLVPSTVKVIGCTAHKAKEEVDKFLASGLDSCIYKPVSIVMIKDILKDFLV